MATKRSPPKGVLAKDPLKNILKWEAYTRSECVEIVHLANGFLCRSSDSEVLKQCKGRAAGWISRKCKTPPFFSPKQLAHFWMVGEHAKCRVNCSINGLTTGPSRHTLSFDYPYSDSSNDSAYDIARNFPMTLLVTLLVTIPMALLVTPMTRFYFNSQVETVERYNAARQLSRRSLNCEAWNYSFIGVKRIP